MKNTPISGDTIHLIDISVASILNV